MKTFVQYFENVTSLAKYQKLLAQIHQRWGQQGTEINPQQVEEIRQLFKQQGEDPENIPVIIEKGTNKSFLG